jgi:hypothetical protein
MEIEAEGRRKMALALGGAFAAGFAAGWLVRSSSTSTRGAIVGLVAVAHRVHHDLSRTLGQAMEWAEDVIAEGRAEYERAREGREPAPPAGSPGPEA